MMNLPHYHYGTLTDREKYLVLRFDEKQGFGPDGPHQNRHRFYTVLSKLQHTDDVIIRTVAVKAKSKKLEPKIKEVVLTTVDDPWLHMRDIAYFGMAGYKVDWYSEGLTKKPSFNYNGCWQTEAYAKRCMWKPSAPVVNPELLLQTKRFKYCAWDGQGPIMDYLKMYAKHPEIEMLSKAGLGEYTTSIIMVKKLKKDKAFKQFVMSNLELIKDCRYGVDAILKAFKKSIPMSQAQREIEHRRWFRGYKLPMSVDAMKAYEYIQSKKGVTMYAYCCYVRNCVKLKLNMDDTKVSFPRQFKTRERIVQDQIDVMAAKANAKKYATLNEQIEALAMKWSKLERSRSKLQIVIPRTVDEIMREGRRLQNCLKQEYYAARVARGECLIVFVRESEDVLKPYVAAEYNLKSGVVTQCYAKNNSKPPKQVTNRVIRAFKEMEKAA